jgi:hypothetical protein
MMKNLLLVITLMLTWFVHSSFFGNDGLVFPDKKVNKAINKIWKDKNIDIQGYKMNQTFGGGEYFLLKDKSDTLGFLYVGRVNSCRQGGCAINNSDEDLPFEFFDYFLITDKNAKIEKIKIFNYQATHGHEVMSNGWLRQFKGFGGEKKLKYGKDIEAISGATISAKAMNLDVQSIVGNLKRNF